LDTLWIENSTLVLELAVKGRIEADSPLLRDLEDKWTSRLLDAVGEQPRIRPDNL
jgi:hypothetical protein